MNIYLMKAIDFKAQQENK